MKIAVRFAIWIVIPLVSLTILFGYLYQLRSRDMLREELAREGRAIALVTQIAVEDYLRDRHLDDLEQLVDRITGYERVLGLRIFDAQGGLIYQSSVLKEFPFRHWNELKSVLRLHRPAQTHRTFGKETAMGFIFPLSYPDGRLAGAVQVLQLESYMRQDAQAIRAFIIGLSFAMIIASLIIILMTTRLSVAHPIERLARRFREVGAGDLSARVEVGSEDELGHLAREFNLMCERLEATHHSLVEEQEERRKVEGHLRNAERLAGLGRLSAGLAHEIGTPLHVISGRANALLRVNSGNEAVEKHLRIISEQIERIVEIVRDMLDFARMRPVRREDTNLADVLEAVLELAGSQLDKEGILVDLSIPENLPLTIADPHQLQQVFLNLLLNAVDAMAEGGVLRIHVEPRQLAKPGTDGVPRPTMVVTFEDTGSGISPEHCEHVFDPFFTTKEAGKGTGLGLSVSYGIVEEHDGWIDLQSTLGKGTQVSVHLPVGSSAAVVAAPESEAA